MSTVQTRDRAQAQSRTSTEGEEPFAVEGCDTLPKLFRHRVRQFGDKAAMREKDLGIWRAVTWREYGEKARAVGLGLVALGLERGDVVSVLSENNKEWLFTDHGTMGAGGVTNGVYTTDSARQLAYLVRDSNTRFLIVEDEEQLDKFLERRDEMPSLEKVFVIDMEGLRDFSDPMVMSIEDLYALGEAYHRDHPDEWDRRVEASRPEDVAILIYTSGTTGPPKGAMITHRNCIAQMILSAQVLPSVEEDVQLSFLPLCHIAERSFSMLWPLKSGSLINFAENLETVPENIREVSPTVFFAVPRIWEKFYSAITIQMKDATRFGRWAYRTALGVAYAAAERRDDGRRPPPHMVALRWLAEVTVFRNIKRALGLDKVRYTASGAAPISPELLRWYRALGVEMYELYGQTETTGIVTSNRMGHNKIGTVGQVIPETELMISPEGEVMVRGPLIFKGYLNQPEKTAETIEPDGWLHTGDVGVIDNEGYLKITDRMKDIIITAGGKNITPSEIENELKFSPYINDAVVIGDKRKYLTVLIMIDHDNVVKFAQDNDVPFTNYASLCHARAVQGLIGEEIDRVNRNFARVEGIKDFRLIDQMLTAEDDELTPTMKLKRKFVNEKYKDLIESMYGAA
jgi:long-chain acyl-CoA synthetase